MWTQSQAKQDDGPEETQKKCPTLSDLNYPKGATLSLSPPLCVYPHVLFFLLINTLLVSLLSISLLKSISTKQTIQGLVTSHWPSWSSG